MPCPRRAMTRPAMRRVSPESSPGSRPAKASCSGAIASRGWNLVGYAVPVARHAASLARRSVKTSPRLAALVPGRGRHAFSIARTLNFLEPRGTATVTLSPGLWPMIARPTGDSLESLRPAGSASADPTIAYWTTSPALHVLQRDLGAHADLVGGDGVRVDDDGPAQALSERVDAGLEHGLLVLGVLVLRVLGDVPEVARGPDAVCDFVALDAREVLDLLLEPLQALGGENDLAVDHGFLLLNAATRSQGEAAQRVARQYRTPFVAEQVRSRSRHRPRSSRTVASSGARMRSWARSRPMAPLRRKRCQNWRR